jgi:hypothetical protein
MNIKTSRAKVINASSLSKRWWKPIKCQLSLVTASMYFSRSSHKQF